MSSKTAVDLTTENTLDVAGEVTPSSITPTNLGALIKDIIDSMYNRIDDALVPAPVNMTKAQLVAAIGGSTLIKGQIITITDRTDGFPLIIQASGTNTISPIGIWINGGVPLAVFMIYTGITDLFTFPVFLDANGKMNFTNQIIIADGTESGGYVLVCDAGGKSSWVGADSSHVDVTNPTAMTGALELMMGLGGTTTPSKSGIVSLNISGEYISNDIVDETYLNIRTGTGVAPVNGAAATGTLQQTNKRVASSGTLRIPFALNMTLALSVGVAYWIDLGIYNLQGTAVQLFNISISTIEQ